MYKHICASPVDLWEKFKVSQGDIQGDLKELLEWLNYTESEMCINSLEDFATFTRKIGYFACQGTQEAFKTQLPITGAIKMHLKRAEYVLKLIFDSCIAFSDVYQNVGKGWECVNGVLQIVWYEEFETVKRSLNEKRTKPGSRKCSCSSIDRCTGKTKSGCINCFWACRPCTVKCKCKGECGNPHNNNGTCVRCHHGTENDQQISNSIQDNISISTAPEDSDFDIEENFENDLEENFNFILDPTDPNDTMLVTELFENFSHLNQGIGNDYGEVQFYDGDLEI